MSASELIIRSVVSAPFEENCWIVGCPETGEGLVFDPGDDVDAILQEVRGASLRVVEIVNTHGHLDHVSGVAELQETLGVPFRIHREDVFLVDRVAEQAALFGLRPPRRPRVDGHLTEGEEVRFGRCRVRVLHTPGHSPGGCSFATGGHVFVGDTLFQDSIGRTDLPGGDLDTLIRSIRERLLPLGPEVVAYPGHGPTTTLGREARWNPFLADK